MEIRVKICIVGTLLTCPIAALSLQQTYALWFQALLHLIILCLSHTVTTTAKAPVAQALTAGLLDDNTVIIVLLAWLGVLTFIIIIIFIYLIYVFYQMKKERQLRKQIADNMAYNNGNVLRFVMLWIVCQFVSLYSAIGRGCIEPSCSQMYLELMVEIWASLGLILHLFQNFKLL